MICTVAIDRFILMQVMANLGKKLQAPQEHVPDVLLINPYISIYFPSGVYLCVLVDKNPFLLVAFGQVSKFKVLAGSRAV